MLTGTYTVSAAGSSVLDVSEGAAATLAGMPTAGDTGNQPRFYNSRLGENYWLPSRKNARASPHGYPMEEKSIQPQNIVSKTIAGYFDNKDSVPAYVLQLIRKPATITK